jgi:hypothetical protein
MKSIKVYLIILSFLVTVSCEFYHPDLISRKESEKRISQACITNLIIHFPQPDAAQLTVAGNSAYEKSAASSAAYLCNYDNHIYANKDEMVRTKDTDSCVSAVLSMPGPAYADIVVQYAIIRNFICDIKAVRFLEFTEPGQGGI